MFVFHKNLALLLILVLISSGCSSQLPLRSQIEGLGPIQLSRNNSEVLPNRFLSEEANASPRLWRFLKSTGSPDAVELKKGFLSSYRGHIYYLAQNKAYLLQERGNDWEIIGPGAIPQVIANGLRDIENLDLQAPLSLASTPNGAIATTEYQRGSLNRKANSIGADQHHNNKSSLASSLGNNDVIHTVIGNNESLWNIAKEYTGSGKNYERLAAINGLRISNSVRPGQKIRIPRYLIKE